MKLVKGKNNVIILNMPLKSDYYIEMFDGQTIDGHKFKFISKKGIKLMFETMSDDEGAAANILKKTVKASKYGMAIYFSVSVK